MSPGFMQAEQEEMFGSVVRRYGTKKKGKGKLCREIVLDAIRDTGNRGATVDELEIRLRLPHQSVSARVHELERRGLIDGCGKRKTRSGRNAWAWVVNPKRCTCGHDHAEAVGGCDDPFCPCERFSKAGAV